MHPGTCQLGRAALQRRAGDILSARAHLQSSNSTVITVVQSYATTRIWRSIDYHSIFQNYTPPNLPINHTWLTIIMKNWLTPSQFIRPRNKERQPSCTDPTESALNNGAKTADGNLCKNATHGQHPALLLVTENVVILFSLSPTIDFPPPSQKESLWLWLLTLC